MNTSNVPESIRRIEYWNPETVQDFCVRHNFYTCGSNEQYEDMLNFVRENDNPTNENIFIVARDILEHSDDEIQSNYVVADVMSLLYYGAVRLDFYYKDFLN